MEIMNITTFLLNINLQNVITNKRYGHYSKHKETLISDDQQHFNTLPNRLITNFFDNRILADSREASVLNWIWIREAYVPI